MAERITIGRFSHARKNALASQEYDNLWDDPHFSEEMDRHRTEYESGEAQLCQFEEMKNAAVAAYKEKKSKR